jgi:hypothetical protein
VTLAFAPASTAARARTLPLRRVLVIRRRIVERDEMRVNRKLLLLLIHF